MCILLLLCDSICCVNSMNDLTVEKILTIINDGYTMQMILGYSLRCKYCIISTYQLFPILAEFLYSVAFLLWAFLWAGSAGLPIHPIHSNTLETVPEATIIQESQQQQKSEMFIQEDVYIKPDKYTVISTQLYLQSRVINMFIRLPIRFPHLFPLIAVSNI